MMLTTIFSGSAFAYTCLKTTPYGAKASVECNSDEYCDSWTFLSGTSLEKFCAFAGCVSRGNFASHRIKSISCTTPQAW